jgi:hypothetical protein
MTFLFQLLEIEKKVETNELDESVKSYPNGN